MNFVKFIENYDSKYGIPRPAEYPHLPPFHAFLRIIQHVVLMIAAIACGVISAYLLWKSAGFLQSYIGIFALEIGRVPSRDPASEIVLRDGDNFGRYDWLSRSCA